MLPASNPNQLERSPPYSGALPTVMSPRMIKYTVMIPARKHGAIIACHDRDCINSAGTMPAKACVCCCLARGQLSAASNDCSSALWCYEALVALPVGCPLSNQTCCARNFFIARHACRKMAMLSGCCCQNCMAEVDGLTDAWDKVLPALLRMMLS